MQSIKRNAPNAGYETDDTIRVLPDSHQFGSAELNSANFTIETGLTLTDDEIAKLEMQDEAPTNFSAIAQLPTFRSLATKSENMKTLHRRKYQNSGNTLVLKPNAQERL